MATRALTQPGTLLPTVFDEFFKPWNEWFGNESWPKALTMPAVNIIENTGDYKVSLAAPGMKKDDFKIDMDGNLLTISSEKEENKEEKDVRYTRKEYSYSGFSRSFTIPEDVKQDKIEATYQDGVLKIVLPKREEAKKQAISKHIAVK